MKIDIETKYDKGDTLWTWGFEIGSGKEIPVQVDVYWIEVALPPQNNLLNIRYGVIPVSEVWLSQTLKSKYQQENSLSRTTDFPEPRWECDLFRTKEEAQDFIDKSLPF